MASPRYPNKEQHHEQNDDDSSNDEYFPEDNGKGELKEESEQDRQRRPDGSRRHR